MLRYEQDELELLDELVATLTRLPHGDARLVAREVAIGLRGRVDAIVEADIAGHPLRLLVEAKRDAFPRDVREAVWQLRNYMAHADSSAAEVLPFFIARSISSGAREILQRERVGYHDLSGTLFVPSKHAYILIDRPLPRKSKKIFTSIFEGQRGRVVQAMLDRPQRWRSVKELADNLGMSAATASSTLSEMERRDWVEVKGAGPSKLRRLAAGGRILDEWTSYLAEKGPSKTARYFVPVASTEELARRVDQACREADVRYAVTGEVAAQTYAPYLSTISQLRCRIAPGRAREEALNRLDARPVREGWNLGLLEARSNADVQVGARIDGIAVAPTVQVYLDLIQGAGRSPDMAAHLRAERLGF